VTDWQLVFLGVMAVALVAMAAAQVLIGVTVLRATRQWERHFTALVPDATDLESVFDYALTDLGFYLEHRATTRRRPLVAARLLPKIARGEPLSGKEMVLAMSERSCFDLLHRQRVDLDFAARTAEAA